MSNNNSSSSNSSSSNSSNNGRRNAVILPANVGNNNSNININKNSPKKMSKKSYLISKGKNNIGKYFLGALIIIVIITLIIYALHLLKVFHIPFFEKDKKEE